MKDLLYPAPQRAVWSFSFVWIFLWLLALLFFGLTLYAILQDNIHSLPIRYQSFFLFKIIDTKSSCTALISCMSLILVRHHFILGLKPRIIYESYKSRKSDYLHLKDSEQIWQVKLKNAGVGSAIFDFYCFRAAFDNIYAEAFDKTFHEIIISMEQNGLEFEKDFWLCNITKGYTITSKDEKIIFELKLSKGKSLPQFDIKIQYKGFLKDKYSKEIFLIPRAGIYEPKQEILEQKKIIPKRKKDVSGNSDK